MSVRAKVSLGRWKGGRPQRSGERATQSGNTKTKNVRAVGAVRKDGRSWTAGSEAVGSTHTLDRKVWEGLGRTGAERLRLTG